MNTPTPLGVTLEDWLDAAVKGFFPKTQERIRREYTAAYYDALEAGEMNVPHGWGDPRRVNRELRRTYLTVQETELLQPVLPNRRKPSPQHNHQLARAAVVITFFIIPLTIFIVKTIFSLPIMTATFYALLFLLPLIILQWIELQKSSLTRPEFQRMFGELWHGSLLLSGLLFTLAWLPWPVQMDAGANAVLTLGGLLFFLTALDFRYKFSKAKTTFPQG